VGSGPWSSAPSASRGLSPRRRLVLVVVLVALVVFVAALVVRIMPGERGEAAGSVPQDQPGPVLLVPGYGGGTAALQVLSDALQATGRDTVLVELPGDGTGDLSAQAAVLQEYVQEALTSGAPSVDVVGFSAGGVVARIWAERYDGAGTARRIVTLGSPHHGTSTASAGLALAPDRCPAACRELVPDSPLLTSLDEPVPSPPRWLALWTTDDTIVVPPESGRLDGAVSTSVQAVCPALTVAHGQLPTDPVVTRFVLDALGPAPLGPPDPRHC
jgi:triacylglycerol lipase